MTELRCTAVKCVYNKEQLCSRGDIQVQGDHAKTMDQTACGSFVERTGEDYSNDCSCGCDTIHIGCTAETCKYNEDKKCYADSVDIEGSHATEVQETNCGTFRCRG
ncbi:MAG: DUF1540 domain-containing protein [Oliverpabstia sp.]